MINRTAFFLFTPILCISACILFINFSRDVENYRSLFTYLSEISIFNLVWIEPFWLFYFHYSSKIFDFNFAASIIIVITVAIKSFVIFKLSSSYIYSILIYSSWFFILQDATQIRVSLSLVPLIFSAYNLSYGRNKKSIVFLITATMIHYSAGSFLIVYFSHWLYMKLNKYITFSSYLILMMAISLILGSIGLAKIVFVVSDVISIPKAQDYLNQASPVSIFSPKVVFTFLFFLFFLINLKRFKFDHFEFLCLHIYTLGLCFYFSFAELGVVAVRLSELCFFFLIFLAPSAVRAIKQIHLSQLILFFLVLCFLFYYILYIGMFFDE